MDERTELPMYKGYFVVANLSHCMLEVRLRGVCYYRCTNFGEARRWIDKKVEADSVKTKDGSETEELLEVQRWAYRLKIENEELKETLARVAKALKA